LDKIKLKTIQFMKKIVLILCLSASATIVSNAQSFRLGFRGGLNLSNMYGDLNPSASISNVTDTKNITGLQGALVAELKFGPFSVVPELAYSQQGLNVNGATLKTDNFNIPVLLRYSLGISKFRVFGNTGPQFGLKLSKEDITQTVTNVDNVKQIITLKSVNTGDFSWLVGVGAGLGFGHGEFFVDARYVITFSPSVQVGIADVLQNGQNASPSFSPGLRAGTVALSIGYAYKFGL
jgi:hypothetical protein